MRRLFSTLAITSCLLAGVPAVSLAQSGLILFGGVKGENQLSYRTDFGGQSNAWDRYRFRISSKKLRVAVAHFVIRYPEYYKGTFDTKKIEVKAGDKKVALSDIKWDKDNHVLEIYPQEAIPAGKNVEIIFSNVKNPSFGGMYNFHCSIQSPGDVPISRYIGTWTLSIN